MKNVNLIAEAGVNHNGDPGRACEMVAAAAEAGADYIKFQTFHADMLVTPETPMADYQRRNIGEGRAQHEMLKSLELDKPSHNMLIDHCRQAGIGFLSTPFGVEEVHFLTDELGLGILKISSGDLTDPQVLLAAANSGADIILSTGMAELAEVEDALSVLAFGYTQEGFPQSLKDCHRVWQSYEGRKVVQSKVTLLQCTSQYPAPLEDSNLKAITTMREVFGLQVGYSDHTIGVTSAIAAVALGASVVEKHFTLDRNLPGPDHAASLSIDELKAWIKEIRNVEIALGFGIKRPAPSEENTKRVARKRLIAAKHIAEGDLFQSDNIILRRSTMGDNAMKYLDLLGKPSPRTYVAGKPINTSESALN